MRWLVPILIASPALAGMPGASDPAQTAPATRAGHFTTECNEAGPCQETAFDAGLTVSPQGSAFAPNAQLASDAGTIGMALSMPGPAGWLARPARFPGGDPTATHLITRAPDGGARYTVHMTDGPILVSYLGTCEETH